MSEKRKLNFPMTVCAPDAASKRQVYYQYDRTPVHAIRMFFHDAFAGIIEELKLPHVLDADGVNWIPADDTKPFGLGRLDFKIKSYGHSPKHHWIDFDIKEAFEELKGGVGREKLLNSFSSVTVKDVEWLARWDGRMPFDSIGQIYVVQLWIRLLAEDLARDVERLTRYYYSINCAIDLNNTIYEDAGLKATIRENLPTGRRD